MANETCASGDVAGASPSASLQSIERFKREVLDGLLAQCTQQQCERFALIYPLVTDDNIEAAIMLCERTIYKNRGAGFPYTRPPLRTPS